MAAMEAPAGAAGRGEAVEGAGGEAGRAAAADFPVGRGASSSCMGSGSQRDGEPIRAGFFARTVCWGAAGRGEAGRGAGFPTAGGGGTRAATEAVFPGRGAGRDAVRVRARVLEPIAAVEEADRAGPVGAGFLAEVPARGGVRGVVRGRDRAPEAIVGVEEADRDVGCGRARVPEAIAAVEEADRAGAVGAGFLAGVPARGGVRGVVRGRDRAPEAIVGVEEADRDVGCGRARVPEPIAAVEEADRAGPVGAGFLAGVPARGGVRGVVRGNDRLPEAIVAVGEAVFPLPAVDSGAVADAERLPPGAAAPPGRERARGVVVPKNGRRAREAVPAQATGDSTSNSRATSPARSRARSRRGNRFPSARIWFWKTARRVRRPVRIDGCHAGLHAGLPAESHTGSGPQGPGEPVVGGPGEGAPRPESPRSGSANRGRACPEEIMDVGRARFPAGPVIRPAGAAFPRAGAFIRRGGGPCGGSL